MKKLLFLLLTICLDSSTRLFPQSTVITDSISSSILNRKVAYNIYLPPSYDQDPAREYPVLYLLNGWGGNNTDWTNSGMAVTMDSVIGNGAKEMVVFMPDGMNSYYCNNYDSRNLRYEDFMMQEMIPQAESKYRVVSTKETRSIAGLSMGGYGATYISFKYAESYSSSYSMSGAVLYGGNEPNLQTLLDGMSAIQIAALPAYTMEIGTSDFLYANNQTWHNLLTAKGIPHTYITREGSHQWIFWDVCLPKAIRFASDNFDKSTGVTISDTKNEIRVYPNPATDLIYVRAPSSSVVLIYDSMGKLADKRQADNSMIIINVEHYPRGLYILVLQQSGRREMRKVVLQ
jgi:S-formylglutathione hydrolase FrmB